MKTKKNKTKKISYQASIKSHKLDEYNKDEYCPECGMCRKPCLCNQNAESGREGG